MTEGRASGFTSDLVLVEVFDTLEEKLFGGSSFAEEKGFSCSFIFFLWTALMWCGTLVSQIFISTNHWKQSILQLHGWMGLKKKKKKKTGGTQTSFKKINKTCCYCQLGEASYQVGNKRRLSTFFPLKEDYKAQILNIWWLSLGGKEKNALRYMQCYDLHWLQVAFAKKMMYWKWLLLL